MNILIITYSREVNPGTFLQAYGVQHIMKQLFPEATIELLKHKRLYNLLGSKEKDVLKTKKDFTFFKSKITAIPRRLKYEWGYKHLFKLTCEEFDLFNYDSLSFKKFAEKYDLIVVGSDTILIDFEKNGRIGLMWLKDIKTKKILFAASAAPGKFIEKLTTEQLTTLKKEMDNFTLLGVRDSLTLNFFSQDLALNEKPYLQYDPTYLIPSEKFSLPYRIKRKLAKIKQNKKIALVNFGANFTHKKLLTQELKKLGYYIISTLYNPYADKNLMTLSPFEWAAIFPIIDLTVTERFHDSVFTLRNCKPVIAIDWASKRVNDHGFSKTSDLLHIYGLDDYHFDFTHNKVNIESVLKTIQQSNNISQQIRDMNINITTQYSNILSTIKEKI